MPTETLNKQNRLVKNSFFGVMSWLLPILPTLIATPIVIEKLGTEQYGLLVVIIGFVSYFFTTSIGKVAAKYVAEYRSTGELEKISPVISATLILGVSVTLLGTIVTAFAAPYIVATILVIPEQLQGDAIIGLYLACVTILTIVIGQVFQLVLQGLQRFDRYLLLANLSSVSFSVGSIVIVLSGYGVVTLLVWNLSTWFLVCVMSYAAAKRVLPDFQFSFSIPKEMWRIVARYAASIIAFQVFGNILLIFERAWIMRNFGGEAVTYYTVPMTLAIYLHLFTASLVLALFPTINELLSEPEKLRDLYRKSTKLVAALLVFGVLSAVVCGEMFLSLWLPDGFAASSSVLLIIHVLTFAILALNTISWQIADSFRAASLNAYATAFWMVAGIAMMLLFSSTWQITGIALGRLAGVLIFIPLIFYVEKRFLGGIFWSFWAAISIRIIIAAVPAVTAEWLVIGFIGNSWLSLVAALVSGVFIYGLTLRLIGFLEESEKRILVEMWVKYR